MECGYANSLMDQTPIGPLDLIALVAGPFRPAMFCDATIATCRRPQLVRLLPFS